MMATFTISAGTAKGKTWKAVGKNALTGRSMTMQGSQKGVRVGKQNPTSEKSFDARHDATGMTPKKYVNKLRWDNKAAIGSSINFPTNYSNQKNKTMIQVIQEAPGNVAAFRATGAVNKEDYDNVVIPVIDALVNKQDSINFMLVLDTSLSNFSITALMKDIGVGLKHFTKWHKMAIVSESGAINTFTDFFSYVAPGEAKGFTHAQLPEATEWVSS